MRKITLVLSVLMMAGFAASFDVSVNTMKGQAGVDNPAEINLEVHNPEETQTFRLSILDYHRSQWYIYEDNLRVQSGENASFNVSINPGDNAIRGNYRTDFLIKSAAGKEFRDSFSYTVERKRGLNLINVDINESYRPEDTSNVGITFRNVDSSTSEYKDVKLSLMNVSKDIRLGPSTRRREKSICGIQCASV